ncbi:MAG TPA: hypothetical protein VFK05_36485 [Polyangiaceae bacterium]|nr:hypothetical protein [Polyangiaceae bacterium]
MKRYLITAFGLTLCFGIACSSNSDEHAPALGDGGASSKGGVGGRSSVAKGGSGAAVAGTGGQLAGAGNAGEAGAVVGEGGNGGNGGEAGEDEGAIIPVTPGSCSETAAWANATTLQGISTDANEQLLLISPDELDILFTRDGVPMRAHRELRSSAFGEAAPLTIAEGYSVEAGAALSADGKTLVLLSTTGQSFAAFTRSSRSEDFDSNADVSAFAAINQRAIQTSQHYAAPVLSPDGKSFVFAAYSPAPEGGFSASFQGVSLVYETPWTGSGWAMPESISQDLFDGTSVARALPSGLSSDSRTLFYLDEGSGTQMARFRDRPDAPLYTVVELDARAHAMPNAECNRLYYSSGGDVLVASE